MVIRERAVDLAEKLGHLATETAEQRGRERAGDTIAAVDRDLHRARERDVSGDAVEVRGGDVRAAIAAGAGFERTGLDARLERLDVAARERVARDDHLEPVVVRRVVAAGDHDAALRLELVCCEIAHRRRDRTDIDHVRPTRLNPIGNGATKLRPGDSAVAGGNHRVAAALLREGTQCLTDAAHDRRRQALADDAADVVGLEDLGRQLRHGEPR